MDIKRSFVYYMTGTGTTESYAKAIAQTLPGEVNVCQLDARKFIGETFGADDLVVVAAPVYGGHIPPFVWSQLADAKGSDTPALAVAVYGARDYDNALLEMQAELAKLGCTVVGAAALVARHSIIKTIAADRPDADDLAGAKQFAADMIARIEQMGSIADAPSFEFKGELAENIEPTGLVPMVTEDCTFCGSCVPECPACAIPDADPNTTNAELCISCLRCIDVCPFDARILPPPVIEGIGGMLAKCADPAKANEYF